MNHKVCRNNQLYSRRMKKLWLGWLVLLSATVGCSSKNKEGESPIYQESHNVVAVADKNATINGSRQNAITKTAKECSPAIVGINVTEVREYNVGFPGFEFFQNDPMIQRFFGKQKQKVHSLGSGFIISSDGYILTNDHVAGRASKVVVTMTSGEKYDAQIIGTDPTTDVALLKIDAKNLPYVKLGNSDDVMVGEWAIAFGNPFGLFDKNARPTVTAGIVSNLGVSFSEQAEFGQNAVRVYKNMIQTDAAISSGNSGGPLINANGEVIGINTVIFSTATNGRGAGSIGIGYAIPINRVKTVVSKLKGGEKFDRAVHHGMVIDLLDEQKQRYYRSKKSEGVIVYQVEFKSPADKAGIEPGDIIVEIDGKKINNDDDFQVAMYDAVVGQTVTIKVERDNDVLTKSLTLEKRR